MTMPAAPLRARVPGPRRPGDPLNAQDQAGSFQDAATTATNAAAASAKYDYGRDVGKRLGSLAGIGALRSGGAGAGIAEAGRTFSERVGNAAAGNAMQAAGLGQQEAASLRGLGFSREELAQRTADAAAGRASTEKIAGNQLAQQGTQFGQELGFKEKSLASGEGQAAAERQARADLASGQQLSSEKIAGWDVASREKLATAELGFREKGLSSEEARAAAANQLSRDLNASDLGFKEKSLEQSGSQFQQDLGFRTSEGAANRTLEQQRQAEAKRQFDQQRTDAAAAAKQKSKSGLFGFIGKALGTVAGFVPGLGTAGKIASKVFGGP